MLVVDINLNMDVIPTYQWAFLHHIMDLSIRKQLAVDVVPS